MKNPLTKLTQKIRGISPNIFHHDQLASLNSLEGEASSRTSMPSHHAKRTSCTAELQLIRAMGSGTVRAGEQRLEGWGAHNLGYVVVSCGGVNFHPCRTRLNSFVR